MIGLRGISIRFARFATGVVLTVDGEDRWVEPDDVRAFIAQAEAVLAKAEQERP